MYKWLLYCCFNSLLEIKNQATNLVGLTYTRWGKTGCQDINREPATVLYEGFVASGFYDHIGGGTNYLCLPFQPNYRSSNKVKQQSLIYTTEFETENYIWENTHDYDVPCVVCFVEKSTQLMIPSQLTCPDQWDMEYSGYLMSSNPHHESNKDFICIDEHPETLFGSQDNTNGALLYFAQAICDTSFMPCPTDGYKHLFPITCIVCTL